ncbi:MAG: hypothetical protein M3Z33_02220 [Actinomycetota bacterium]|nr:hypothetical protein [Actinomycetota bacterium]
MHARVKCAKLAAIAAVLLSVTAQAAHAAAGPTVTIRIEGENATLVPRTSVTTSTDPVSPGCPGTSVAGAIEVATRGNWDRQSFTRTIAGETHDFSRSDYWSSFLNNKVGNGICTDLLQPGDDVLITANFSGPPPDYAPTVVPLAVEGVPAVAERGGLFTVTAVEYRTDASGSPGTGTRTPTAGVTVSAGGASGVTGPDGRVTLRASANGSVSLQAAKGATERSQRYPICVHDAGDGGCGGVAQPSLTGSDLTGPAARIAGIRSGKRYSRRTAPRLLSGVVDPDPSGLKGVYLRLWSHRRGRCTFYNPRTETLRRGGCGSRRELVFVGDRSAWSYLLPFRLPPGHYRLDVIGVDRLGNGSPIVPGGNRVDFYVR